MRLHPYGMLIAALGTLVCAEQTSYPLFAVNFREVGNVHKEINNLRKEYHGELVPGKQVQLLITRMLYECPSDTYVFINQPGAELGDFQDLVTPSGITLWSELRKFSERSSTIASFPRLDVPMDLNKLERSLSYKCNTRTIHVNPKQDPLFERYDDTQPRILRIELEPLPEDEMERDVVLKRNDDLLQQALALTPSPFFSIVYTSTTGEPYDPEDPAFKKEKHWDIFSDIARAKRDPRNRGLWKNQEFRKPYTRAINDPINPVPNAEQKRRSEQRQKKRERLKGYGQPEVLQKETVGLIMLATVGLGLIMLVIKGLNSMRRYFTAADMTIQTPAAISQDQSEKNLKHDQKPKKE